MLLRTILSAIAIAAVLVPSVAHAYLMDANDARTLDPGTLEMELQPIGYYQVLSEEQEHHLVAPSLMLYLGLADGLDFIFLTRGFFLTDDVADVARYRTWESTVAFRFLLVPGRYSTEDVQGPSIVLQVGLMIPNVNGDGELPGAQVGLLLGQQWDAGTLHANAWLTYTTWQAIDVFLAAAIEGPPEWDVRPLVEVWYDHDTEYGDLLSGLVGAYFDATDHLTFEVGVRMAAWEDYSEIEARVSMWIGFPTLWTTHESHDDDCSADGDSGPDPASHPCPSDDGHPSQPDDDDASGRDEDEPESARITPPSQRWRF